MARQLLQDDNFSLWNFAALIRDEASALEAAYEWRLLSRNANCPMCHRLMGKQSRPDLKLGFRWRCNHRQCRTTLSPTKDTWFEKTKITVLQTMRIFVHWFLRHPVIQAAKQVIFCLEL